VTDDDYRARDLDLREKDILTRNAELQARREEMQRERKPLSLANTAVLVTIIAGIAGVLFAAMGLVAAQSQKDADGLRLFVESQDKFVKSCTETTAGAATAVASADQGPVASDKPAVAAKQPASQGTVPGTERSLSAGNLKMLEGLYPDLKSQFEEVANIQYQTCISGAAQAAFNAAKALNASPAAALVAADNARYAAMSATVLPSAAATSAAKLPTVYIQYTTQKDQATQLQSALQSQGYNVPGIQHVSAAPTNAEVRFYYPDQSRAAGELSAAIAKALGASPPASHSIGSRYANLPDNTLEFWFPAK
jgi:hypothetical protein